MSEAHSTTTKVSNIPTVYFAFLPKNALIVPAEYTFPGESLPSLQPGEFLDRSRHYWWCAVAKDEALRNIVNLSLTTQACAQYIKPPRGANQGLQPVVSYSFARRRYQPQWPAAMQYKFVRPVLAGYALKK